MDLPRSMGIDLWRENGMSLDKKQGVPEICEVVTMRGEQS